MWFHETYHRLKLEMTPPQTKRSPSRKPFDGVFNLISPNRTSPEVFSDFSRSRNPSQMSNVANNSGLWDGIPLLLVYRHTCVYIHEYIEDNWGDLNLHIFAPLVSFMDLDGESECLGMFFSAKVLPWIKRLGKVEIFWTTLFAKEASDDAVRVRLCLFVLPRGALVCSSRKQKSWDKMIQNTAFLHQSRRRFSNRRLRLTLFELLCNKTTYCKFIRWLANQSSE